MPRHPADSPDRAPRSRNALRILLALCLVVLSPAAPLVAQQQGDAASRLREQIAAFSAADKDATLPPGLRRANRQFLNQRRAELAGVLKVKAETLRNYLSTVGRHLSTAERQPLEKSLAQMEEEVARLGQDLDSDGEERADPPSTQATPITTPSVRATARRAAPSPVSDAQPPTGTQPAVVNAPPSAAAAPAPAGIQSDCYPNAPQPLVQGLTEAAQLIVTNKDPGEVSTRMYPILFFSVADAITSDAQEKSVLNSIDIERAKQETKRTDKQVGASARSDGSTSAAEKPGLAELLGFAVEHGTIQQSVSGTTLTLSTTPYALLLAGREDTATAYSQNSDWTRLGISATFNISDENNPLLSARRQQLSEWSAKYRFLGDLSSRSKAAQKLWDEKIRKRVGQFSVELQGGLIKLFNRDDELAAKADEMSDSFTAPDFVREVQAVLNSGASDADKQARIAGLLLCKARAAIYEPAKSGALRISPELRSRIVNQTLPNIASALQERQNAINEFKQGLEELSHRPVFTFAYTNKREAAGSDYSNLRLLFSKKSAGGMNIIANGGISFYHRPDRALNQQRVRDIAAALSLEGTAGRSPFMLESADESRITFAFTGRYQRMFENRGVAGRKADIAVGQFKIEVPIFAGMTLPFSVTYANATELIKEDHVRANFGFSLDTDKLRQVLLLGALRRTQ